MQEVLGPRLGEEEGEVECALVRMGGRNRRATRDQRGREEEKESTNPIRS